MSRDNEVFEVLVVSNNSVLDQDKRTFDLADGQLGIFDKHTNKSLSVDSLTKDKLTDVYFGNAYMSGGGLAYNITKPVDSGAVGYVNYKANTASTDLKLDVKNFLINDNHRSYGIKVYLSSEQISMTQGYIQYSKSYDIYLHNDEVNDPNYITKKFVEAINLDGLGILTATPIARAQINGSTVSQITDTKNAGDALTMQELGYIIDYNKTQGATYNTNYIVTDFEVSVNRDGQQPYTDINVKYFYPRQYSASIYLQTGFENNGTTSVKQQLVMQQGSGYDVRELEYEAMGDSNTPYRRSALFGLAFPQNYAAKVDKMYDLFTISYDRSFVITSTAMVLPSTLIIAVDSTATDVISKLKTFLAVS